MQLVTAVGVSEKTDVLSRVSQIVVIVEEGGILRFCVSVVPAASF